MTRHFRRLKRITPARVQDFARGQRHEDGSRVLAASNRNKLRRLLKFVSADIILFFGAILVGPFVGPLLFADGVTLLVAWLALPTILIVTRLIAAIVQGVPSKPDLRVNGKIGLAKHGAEEAIQYRMIAVANKDGEYEIGLVPVEKK